MGLLLGGAVKKPSWLELVKLRGIANYQFGRGAGDLLFKRNIKVTHSRSTGRMRLIYHGRKLIATLRPSDGRLALAIDGARLVLRKLEAPALRVVVRDEARDFIRMGRNVFAKHVIDVDKEIRPQDEAIVVDKKGELLAVGKAILSGEEMLSFSRGVAVRVRRGSRE